MLEMKLLLQKITISGILNSMDAEIVFSPIQTTIFEAVFFFSSKGVHFSLVWIYLKTCTREGIFQAG
jgi:hypothetical protein